MIRLVGKWACVFVLCVLILVSVLTLNENQLFSENEKEKENYTPANVALFSSNSFCDVQCKTGNPCSYKDQLDLRIIVITYNRPDSLQLCLDHVGKIDTLGGRVGVDIWIDRNSEGSVDNKTVAVAKEFAQQWKSGRVCVHVQEKSAMIGGQWIDTWRPKPNTEEIALFLEDDVDVSSQAYRWLKTMRKHFRNDTDVAGYGLQMQNVNVVRGRGRPLSAPKSDVIFMYLQFTTWGFAPDAMFWRQFQDWYHDQRKEKDFRPYVPQIVSTVWFKNFVKQHKENGMWSMWFTYFCYVHNKYTVLPNLIPFTGRKDVLLTSNRQEAGLHFKGHRKTNKHYNDHLLKTWNRRFEYLPNPVKKYGFDGVLKT